MKLTGHGKIGLLLLIICLFALSTPLSYLKANQRKNVLVLHSYHKGIEWTNRITQGIESALHDTDQELGLHIEYMDTKRIHDTQHFQNLYELYKHKFRNRRFDLIVSSDDHALNFLLAHHQELFYDTPIVFCGVNDFKDSMLVGHNLITGVVESFDIKGSIDVALQLHPNTKEVFVIVDKTLSGAIIKKFIIKDIPYFKDVLRFTLLEDLDMPEALERVKNLSRDSIVFLISLLIDRSGNTFSFERSCSLLSEYSAVPIYSHTDAYLGRGIVGGKLNCGDAQGQIAGEIALRILHGEKVKDIPVVKKSPNCYKFDYQQMERFGIKPSGLPEGSIVINRPHSFYSEHGGLAWSIVACIVGLVLIILILSATIIRRKKVEETLTRSKEKFAKTFHYGPSLMTISSIEDDKYIEVNENFVRITGYSKEESIGTTSVDLGFISKEELDKLKQELIRNGCIDGIELMLKKKNGDTLYCLYYGEIISIDGEQRLLSIASDITERKQTEEILRRYEHIISSTDDLMSFVDTNYMYQAVNEAYLRAFAKKREDIVGHSVAELMGKETFNNVIKGYLDCALAGEIVRYQFWYDLNIGLRFMDVAYQPFKNREGKISGVVVSVHDITEHKRAEEALRYSESQKKAILDASIDRIRLSDTTMKTIWANEVYARELNVKSEDLIGQHCYKVLVDRDSPCPECPAQKALITGQVEQAILTRHESFRGGNNNYLDSHAVPIKNESGEIVNIMHITRDITDKIKAEEEKENIESQLRQAQKMEALGILAGGIAHDFNNILFPIIGYAEMGMLDVSEDSKIRKNLIEILNASKRAGDLVQQILTFSRQQEQELKPLKAQFIIKEALRLIRSSLPTTIEIHQYIEKDCAPIMADPTQIHQVVMNLCTNAYHAMEEAGGSLKVNLSQVEVSIDEAAGPDMEPGCYLCLTVSDTGPGIDQSTMERIFDPYFTTKEKGKGTGLGLAVVHGIVKGYRGDIRVCSEPGKGTSFNVYIPVIKTSLLSSEIVSEEPLQTGHEHILLVDDEIQIIDMEKQLLERLGYQVTTRTSSIDALEAFRAASAQFDLVITDMTMPNMTGDELAAELKSIRSDIPIILCTGFSEKISKGNTDKLGIDCFLMKPIVMKDLARTVREGLN